MAKKHKQHKYPKTRKPRNTEYSVTHKILNEIGKDKLYEIWSQNGHRKTSKILTDMLEIYVSTMVVQYIAQKKFNWQRIVTDKTLPIYKGVLAGTVDPAVYKSIIFQ